MRLHVIGQYRYYLLEQFDRLVGFSLGLDQLRHLKKRAWIIRPEFQGAPQERLRLFQLPILAVEPAETDVGDEVARVEFKLLFELLNRQFACAGEQMRHAELRMRGRQLRVEPRGLFQLFDRGLKLAARQVEQAEYQVGFGRAEFLEDLVDQRAPFLDLVVQQVGRGQRVGGCGVVGLRAVNLFEFRRRFFQLACFEQAHPQKKTRLHVVGLRFDDRLEFAERLLIFVSLVVSDAEVKTDRVFFRIDGQRLPVPSDRLIVLAQFSEDDPEVRERVNPARDQLQRGLVCRARAFQIALLL